MIRWSLLSLAALVAAAVVSSPADEKKAAKEGFRVYSVSLRCQARSLHATYASDHEALRAVTELRGKHPHARFEVTTGSEGKQVPRPGSRPVLYHVYTMTCYRGGWQRQPILIDAKRVAEAVQAHKKKGAAVEVIHDYAPKEVYHVYGSLGCSRTWALRGTYVRAAEALEAARGFRTDKTFPNAFVATGTRGKDYYHIGSPTQFKVHVGHPRLVGRWSLVETTTDRQKAQQAVEAWKKKRDRVEVVRHFAGK